MPRGTDREHSDPMVFITVVVFLMLGALCTLVFAQLAYPDNKWADRPQDRFVVMVAWPVVLPALVVDSAAGWISRKLSSKPPQAEKGTP